MNMHEADTDSERLSYVRTYVAFKPNQSIDRNARARYTNGLRQNAPS